MKSRTTAPSPALSPGQFAATAATVTPSTTPTKPSVDPIISKLFSIAQTPAAERQTRRDLQVADTQARVEPLIEEARALVTSIQAQRTESLAFIEALRALDWADLRASVPVTVDETGLADTRATVSLLEREANAAHQALDLLNVHAVEKLVGSIEYFVPIDARRAIGLLGELDRVMISARSQPHAACTHIKNTKRLLARLEADLTAGKGRAQEPEPEAVTIKLIPSLPQPPDTPARADGHFDVMAS